MKIKIIYPTKERKYLTEGTFQYVSKSAELEPMRIFRSPCGRIGDAAHRYYYSADFKAPSDAEFVNNGLIREQINRKDNPHFKPKKLEWKYNVCNL